MITSAALLASSAARAQSPPPGDDPMKAFGGPSSAPGGAPAQPAAPPAQPAGAQGQASVSAQAAPPGVVAAQPTLVPRTVTKGGGAARTLGWVSFGLGVTSAVGAAGSFVGAKIADDQGIGEIADPLYSAALVGGITSGVLLATSLTLLLATDAKTTETVYEPVVGGTVVGSTTMVQPGTPPSGSMNAVHGAAAPRQQLKFTLARELPYGAYAVTAGALTLSVALTAYANSRASDLLRPEAHPNPEATEILHSDAVDARSFAVGSWFLTGATAIWAAVDTYRAVARVNASKRIRAGLGPTQGGAAVSLVGRF